MDAKPDDGEDAGLLFRVSAYRDGVVTIESGDFVPPTWFLCKALRLVADGIERGGMFTHVFGGN